MSRATKFEKAHLKQMHEYLIWNKKILKSYLIEKPRYEFQKRITHQRSTIESIQKDIRHFKQILRKRR